MEIAAIVADAEAPTFANTIEALDTDGAQLTRVRGVFGLLAGMGVMALSLLLMK